MTYGKSLFALLLALCLPAVAAAQQSKAYLNYIEQYSDWAVEQMQTYGIPASITLAQGLLESRAGQSRLALEAHNHFGIKVGGSWTGPYILKDDDAPNEKFRKYGSARESYIDHSLFLRDNRRYSSLFQLSTDDYEGWAWGLKRCGYATSFTYAQSLIKIIELYDLAEYDKCVPAGRSGQSHIASADAVAAVKRGMTKKIKGEYSQAADVEHGVFMNNKNYYIIAESGDTFETIACEVGVSPSRLRKYNEMPEGYELSEGDIIYLESKRNKAEPRFAGHRHVIKDGESMHSIAQLYGIKLKSLYSLNAKPKDYAAQAGDILWVR